MAVGAAAWAVRRTLLPPLDEMPYACAMDAQRRTTNRCLALMSRPTASWTPMQALGDAAQLGLMLLTFVGLAAAVPERRVPLLTDAGMGSLATLFLHVYLTPFTDPLCRALLLGLRNITLSTKYDVFLHEERTMEAQSLLGALALCFAQVCLYALIGRVLQRAVDRAQRALQRRAKAFNAHGRWNLCLIYFKLLLGLVMLVLLLRFCSLRKIDDVYFATVGRPARLMVRPCIGPLHQKRFSSKTTRLRKAVSTSVVEVQLPINTQCWAVTAIVVKMTALPASAQQERCGSNSTSVIPTPVLSDCERLASLELNAWCTRTLLSAHPLSQAQRAQVLAVSDNPAAKRRHPSSVARVAAAVPVVLAAPIARLCWRSPWVHSAIGRATRAATLGGALNNTLPLRETLLRIAVGMSAAPDVRARLATVYDSLDQVFYSSEVLGTQLPSQEVSFARRIIVS